MKVNKNKSLSFKCLIAIRLLVLFAFLFLATRSFSQFPGCPSVDVGNDTSLTCTQNCVDLTATAFQTGLTTSYTASSIPHNPPIAYNAAGGTAVSVGLDDVWSPPIIIPFNFCYYGSNYNVINVGSNGSIRLGNGTPAGSFQTYVITNPCPHPSLVDGGNIFGVYHDIDPTVSGNVKWHILGTAPCRIFVVSFNNIGHFDCTDLRSTSMIVLYETTNVIDVYVQEKETCTSWNSGFAIIGIQNQNGSAGLTAPGRNANAMWTISSPEAWRFTPSGPTNYTINWFDGATQVGTGETINVCPTTTTTYTAVCTYTMCNGSTVVETDQINVNVSGFPNAGQDSSISVCQQAPPINLFPLLGSGVSPNGTWKNNLGQVITMPYVPATMDPGIYTYSVDSNGCVATAEITVTEINTTVSTSVTNLSCIGANDGSVSVTYTNGTTYSLNGAAFVPTSASPFVINNLSPGTYTLQINGTIGCSATTNFTITEPSPLQITFVSPDQTICPGVQTSLSATATGGSSAYIFTWSGSDGSTFVGNPINVSPNATTTYTVVLSEACGSPTATASVTITTLPNIDLTLLVDDDNGCVPHAVNFENTTSSATIISSTINFGDGNSTSTIGLNPFSHVYNSGGIYSVTITSLTDIGCYYTKTYSDLIEVYSLPNPNFVINPNPVSIFDPVVNIVKLYPNPTDSYVWSIDGGTPSSSTLQNFKVEYPVGIVSNYPIQLIVTSEYGCIDSMTQIVQLFNEVIIYAPNTFTPDGNEFNNDWRVYIDGIDQFDFQLLIFNRWGEIVWESKDSKVAWDGTYGGNYVQEGTYTWTIRCKDAFNDEKYNFEGHLNVIR
jgi:gliding motility-associated-like protein